MLARSPRVARREAPRCPHDELGTSNHPVGALDEGDLPAQHVDGGMPRVVQRLGVDAAQQLGGPVRAARLERGPRGGESALDLLVGVARECRGTAEERGGRRDAPARLRP